LSELRQVIQRVIVAKSRASAVGASVTQN